jgi:hypothetical protein
VLGNVVLCQKEAKAKSQAEKAQRKQEKLLKKELAGVRRFRCLVVSDTARQ